MGFHALFLALAGFFLAGMLIKGVEDKKIYSPILLGQPIAFNAPISDGDRDEIATERVADQALKLSPPIATFGKEAAMGTGG